MKLMCVLLVWMMAAYVHLGPATVAQVESDSRDEDLIDQVRSADRIVRGTVVGVTSRYASNEQGDHFIMSTIELSITEIMKGSRRAPVTFHMPGGIVGDIGMGSSEYESVPTKGDLIVAMTAGGALIPHGLLKLSESGKTVQGHATVAQVRAAIKGAR